jgi:hypothetical protein
MDDLVVEFNDMGTKRVLDLQIKRSVTISSAESNGEFRGIITAVQTKALESKCLSANMLNLWSRL